MGGFESLAERFSFEGQIGRFDLFAVIGGSAYFDESSDETTPKGRIGIAGAVANAHQWLGFETAWRGVLTSAGREPGDFHAVKNTTLQRELNKTCADLIKEWAIGSLCVTIRESFYERCTTELQRNWFGGTYGFARYVCFMAISETVKSKGESGIGYYVEQGGEGVSWIMEHLGIVYRDDKLRASRCMAAYGPADRRIHLPVHVADLVSHEVITSRHTSSVLRILGPLVAIDDLDNESELEDLISAWTKDQLAMNRFRDSAKRRKKAER